MTAETPGGVSVTVLGSANMDFVVRTDRLPRPGETVLGRHFATIGGGKGANQAIAVARAGASCTAIAAVGDDTYGASLRDGLRRAGVDIELVRTFPGPSGIALISVDDSGENQIVVAPGANDQLLDLGSDDVDAIAAARVLVLQLEIPLATVSAAAAVAQRSGTKVLLNAAPARAMPDDLLARCDLLVVNESEAQALAGSAGAEALLRLVPRVVTTLGAAGARYADRDGTSFMVPAPAVTAVDTTAAGDAFVGALAVAWAEERPMRDAIGWACAAGAAATTVGGASASLPHRDAIDRMYASVEATASREASTSQEASASREARPS